jgi:lysophospholipase L1-like esterase
MPTGATEHDLPAADRLTQPPAARRHLAWLGAGALLLAPAPLAWQAAQRLQAGRALAAAAVPSQAFPARPAYRLLVVGDSTAVGTGASAPARSLVGRIAAQHPDWEIRNQAHNGARFADLPAQLATAGTGYDAVLVLAGGNDVIRLTPRERLQAQVDQVVRTAGRHGARVVLMPAGNVGHAPFFKPPLSWWMGQRSQALHDAAAAVARARGAQHVDLLLPRAQDPFVHEAGRLHAADGLHPSDDGYALWYAQLARQGGLPLAPPRDGL